ncbi:MAG: diadenylate cyclase CdaA [Clostridia bacterium]|nr:diadenylate cyclase CdaA [Clostridia bacterium]
MFETIGTAIGNVWAQIVGVFGSINILSALLDIVLLTLVFYFVLRLVRDSRAEQLLKGLLILFAVYLLAEALHLDALSFVLELLFDNALILAVVIFQPELRRLLERVGHSRFQFGSLNAMEENAKRTAKAIDHVCNACEILRRQKMGALIVFERSTMLGDIAMTGTAIDADSSAELIGNIFFNKAPLHDGAMILREGRILAAGCILPLTDKLEMSSELGTRHRAAVGMSENSDAVVVVVSEETGAISVAMSGVLRRDFTKESLKEYLDRVLAPADVVARSRKWFGRGKGGNAK